MPQVINNEGLTLVTNIFSPYTIIKIRSFFAKINSNILQPEQIKYLFNNKKRHNIYLTHVLSKLIYKRASTK